MQRKNKADYKNKPEYIPGGVMAAAKITLRAQWSSAQSRWRIVKKTNSGAGGWSMFGGSQGYTSKTECEAKIKMIIETNPDLYKEG